MVDVRSFVECVHLFKIVANNKIVSSPGSLHANIIRYRLCMTMSDKTVNTFIMDHFRSEIT